MTLLVFVEDPGAVNYIAPLVLALQTAKNSLCIVSGGVATTILREKGLSPHAIVSSEEALVFLDETLPTLVLVGTSENKMSPGLALISAARTRGITSIGLVDFKANAAYRFRGMSDDPRAYAPDWLLVPDEETAKDYEHLGFFGEQIVVTGHPHHEHLLATKALLDKEGRENIRKALFPAMALDQQLLVFASELSTGLNSLQYQRSSQYTLLGHGATRDRTAIVLEELLMAIETLTRERNIPRPYLVLRQHPKENASDLAEYWSEFDGVSSGGDPLRLLFAADGVVGLSSMVLAEAHALGVGVLSILPRELERDWLPLIKTNTIPCATRRADVVTYLYQLLATKKPNIPITPVGDSAITRILQFLQTYSAESKRGIFCGQ